jgi:hypothetical protein
MKKSYKDGLLVLVVVIALGFATGYLKMPTGAVVSGGGGGPSSLGGSGVCPDTGSVNVRFYGQESIPDPTTGSKAGVPTTFSLYQGNSPVAYTTALELTSTSGEASTSTDPTCGSSGWSVIANGTSAATYPVAFDLPTLPNAKDTELIIVDMPQISGVTLYGYNTSNPGDQSATGMVQKWASSTSYNIKLEILPDTTETIRKPLVGLKWNACNVGTDCNLDTSANTTVVITEHGFTPAQCGIGGNAYDGYDDCWTYNGNIENGNSKIIQLGITTGTVYGGVSGQNMTVLVSDLGAYVLDGKLYEAYSNPATGERPYWSGTAGTMYVKFTSAA